MSDQWTPDEELGFDALDSALGDRLRSAAPRSPDVDATLDGLRPRLARARRRHRALLVGATALGVAVISVAVVVAFRPADGPGVKTPPATHPDRTPTTARDATVTTVPVTPDSAPGTGATAPGSTPPTVDDHGGGGSGSGSGPGSGSSGSGSGSSGSGSGSSGSGSGSGNSGSGSGNSGPGSGNSGSGNSGSGSGSSGSGSSGSGSGS